MASRRIPITANQLEYLGFLRQRVDPDRFEAVFADAVAGTEIPPVQPGEDHQQAIGRIGKTVAVTLISALKDAARTPRRPGPGSPDRAAPVAADH